MKAAFVTGGGGYLGSKLCCELVSNGCSVTAYDLSFPDVESEFQTTEINRIHVSASLTDTTGDIDSCIACRET